MEKASWVEDIAWSRRCRWVIDTVRGLENMLAIDWNIEPIGYLGLASVKGRPESRGSYLVGTGQAVFDSVSHCGELAFLGPSQRGRRCEFRMWSRTKIKLGSASLDALAQRRISDMTWLYHAVRALRFPAELSRVRGADKAFREHTCVHTCIYPHPTHPTRQETRNVPADHNDRTQIVRPLKLGATCSKHKLCRKGNRT